MRHFFSLLAATPFPVHASKGLSVAPALGAPVGNVVLPFDGDFEALRRTLSSWGFEVGERPNAPLFARGPGVTLHAYRTGKLLLAGARAEEWARELKGEVAPAPAEPASDETIGWVMHFDGLCQPRNPGGVAAYGYQIHHDGKLVHEGSGLAAPPGPDATNNVAEFTALVEGLRWLRAHGATAPIVRGDSQLVIETLHGRWKLTSPRLKPLHDEAKGLIAELHARLGWVPREENAEADRLSRVGYADAVRAHPEWGLR
jgi:ribonuclease HI